MTTERQESFGRTDVLRRRVLAHEFELQANSQRLEESQSKHATLETEARKLKAKVDRISSSDAAQSNLPAQSSNGIQGKVKSLGKN